MACVSVAVRHRLLNTRKYDQRSHPPALPKCQSDLEAMARPILFLQALPTDASGRSAGSDLAEAAVRPLDRDPAAKVTQLQPCGSSRCRYRIAGAQRPQQSSPYAT